MSTRQPPEPKVVEDLSEMDKILSNVAMGASIDINTSRTTVDEHGSGGILDTDLVGIRKHKKNKKHKKKKKKRSKRRSQDHEKEGSSGSSDSELDVTTADAHHGTVNKKTLKTLQALSSRKGPKPKFHTPAAGAMGITAAAARPRFSSSDENEKDSENERQHAAAKTESGSEVEQQKDYGTSNEELASSDLDTDFSAHDQATEERVLTKSKRLAKPSAKVLAAAQNDEAPSGQEIAEIDLKPTLKLKIKLPPKPEGMPFQMRANQTTPNPKKMKPATKTKRAATPSAAAAARKQAKLSAAVRAAKTSTVPKLAVKKKKKNRRPSLLNSAEASNLSEKMRRSLALNLEVDTDTEDSDSAKHDLDLSEDEDGGEKHVTERNENNVTINHTAQSAAETKVYCYCQSPHDAVSEMIGRNKNSKKDNVMSLIKFC